MQVVQIQSGMVVRVAEGAEMSGLALALGLTMAQAFWACARPAR